MALDDGTLMLSQSRSSSFFAVPKAPSCDPCADVVSSCAVLFEQSRTPKSPGQALSELVSACFAKKSWPWLAVLYCYPPQFPSSSLCAALSGSAGAVHRLSRRSRFWQF